MTNILPITSKEKPAPRRSAGDKLNKARP